MERLVGAEGKVLLVLGVGAVLWSLRWSNQVDHLWRKGGGAAARLVASRNWAFGCVLLVSLGVGAGLSGVRWPLPMVQDEFSYLLAADTYAGGRATTPPHSLWRHFDAPQVLQHPTYQSKYPPAQGLALALGQVLTGRPVVGAWLSFAGMCVALWWMLRAWLPPGWALLGGLLPVVRWGVFGRWEIQRFFYWSQSAWGGAVAAGAGALVFGALRRIHARPRARDGWILAAGLGLLANSRPYEGLLAALPVAGVLLVWAVRRLRRGGGAEVAPVVSALCAGLLLAATLTGAYNARVTGSPLRMPYLVHQDAQGLRHFGWRAIEEHKPRLEEVLRDGRPVRPPPPLHSWQARLLGWGDRYLRAWRFYLGWALTLPLLCAVPGLGLPWVRFAAVTLGFVAVANLATVAALPHYFAPVAPLLLFLVVDGLRRLDAWRPRGRAAGRGLALTVMAVCLLTFGVAGAKHVAYAGRTAAGEPPWFVRRAEIQRQLERGGEEHLVLVTARSDHFGSQQWVANGADIDASPVVWARDLGPGNNGPLLDHFSGRTLWRLDAGPRGTTFARGAGAP